MTVIQMKGEQLRKAIKYVSEMRKVNPDTNLVTLIDDAAFRYDLSPKDSDFLARFVKDEAA